MIFFSLISLLVAFPTHGLELETKNFFICQQKTATSIESRTLRIHQFPEEKKCAVIYSVKGQDKVISYGRWLGFCKNTAKKVLSNLQKGLWECEETSKVKVFYSLNNPN